MSKLNTPYSSLKILHHNDKLEVLRGGGQPVPLQVQIIVSDLCNHDCSFCAYRMSGYSSNQHFGVEDPITHIVNNNPNRMIPFDKIIEILDDCVAMGVKAIQYTGGGEPSVHPQWIDILQATLDRGLELAVVTNGTNMKDGVPELYARAKWVRISVDAGKAETYASIRSVPESYFQRTWNNIHRVVDAKAAAGTDLIIGVGFVVVKENYGEMLDACLLASVTGVDNLRISAVFTTDEFEYHKDFCNEAKRYAAEASKTFSKDGFQVFNLYDDRIHDLESQQPDYEFCGYMHLDTYIGGDQNVYRCCVTAYNDQGFVGSIKDQSFRSLWESQEKKDSFDSFDARTCDRCMFNEKNRTINYGIVHDPMHVNFI
tara:strand:- start:36984 stop:38096 length:1113 start_codon:yes stop_codon:yes gene_type:complete